MKRTAAIAFFAATLLFSGRLFAQTGVRPPKNPVGIDFSYAGYEAGGRLPSVPSVLTVRPSGGDDTLLLQGALDRVSTMPLRPDGFRGALLLQAGRYRVRGQIHLRISGVVLRGVGVATTAIVAEGADRRSLVMVGAAGDPTAAEPADVTEDARAGSRTLTLASVEGLTVGDAVVVRRPSTQEWISAISMSGLPGTFANQRLDWKPGSHDLRWDRTVVSIDAARKMVELDAPITTALEAHYGLGTVAKVTRDDTPTHIGIEGLTLESAYDAAYPKDEDHSWIAIQMDRVRDAWVRNVTARHFVSSAVRVNWGGRRITLEEVRSEAPVAEIAGYRRQGFVVNGQQVLVHHGWSEAGMNDFASGLLAAGPNVFLDCEAKDSLGASGAFEGWASGVLYERVHVPSARLQLLLDFGRAQGGGWTAANSLLWDSSAQSVDGIGPPGAPNFVVNDPRPLYESELKARSGVALAEPPPVPQSRAGLAEFRVADIQAHPEIPLPVHTVEIVNGRFVVDDKTMWGPSQGEAWWRGDTSPLTAVASTGSSVTRFMPGVTAPGETEDLTEFAARLKARNIVTFQVTPGLWYEHRRDAHTVERRDDGNVWAPFYEMPWERSGKGFAWDGLSRFDVSRYNPWYFDRHREFARQAAAQGFLVVYELYNDHDVLEIGPHWIDYPWRPANNVNDTGLPEPPPFKPHNRNDVGNEFFSADYAPLRALHRAYMMHTFDELADQPNIVFSMAYQYAGPLEFEQFFQDVAREWEQKHGRKIRIALITSKATTDAILTDPVRSQQVAIVDMRYWEYRPDGTLWAPPSGINRAFREQIQAEFPGYSDTPPATTPQQVYRAVREYRDKYPNIALMPMEEGAGPMPLLMGGAASESALVGGRPPTPPRAADPVAMAESAPGARPGVPTGGALTSGAAPAANRREDARRVVDRFVATYLAASLMKLSPKDGLVADPADTWVLAGAAGDPVLLYSLRGSAIKLSAALPASRYRALWFDPATGESKDAGTIAASANQAFNKPGDQPWLLLLRPE
jgi:hypothetical protein